MRSFCHVCELLSNSWFSFRTIRQVLDHHGFDHYLLKTPACDIRSLLALKLKQRMLTELNNDLPNWKDDKRKQELKREYGMYLENYSPEDIEWYGLSWEEAIKKMRQIVDAENPIIPHKVIFRSKLIEQLRAVGIEEAQDLLGAK